MPAPWKYIGVYALTGAYDPQAVCTAFEAEANVSECVALGSVGEAIKTVGFLASTSAVNENVSATATVHRNTATGGTWTLTVNKDGGGAATSGSIAWNANAATVETAVEAIAAPSEVVSATVTGTGTVADPWIIAINDEVDDVVFTSTSTALTGGTSTGVTVTETVEAAGLNATDTTITFDTGNDGFAYRAGRGVPFYLTIDNEVVKVTGVSGANLTVKRGAQGTAAVEHDVNAVVTFPADTVSNTGTILFRVGSDTSVAAITNAATALQGASVPVAVAPGYPPVA